MVEINILSTKEVEINIPGNINIEINIATLSSGETKLSFQSPSNEINKNDQAKTPAPPRYLMVSP